MEAHLIFSNVAFKQPDGYSVLVKKGDTFRMALVDAGDAVLQWTTSKDPVLKVMEVDANTVDITTEGSGTSRVLLLNAADTAVFRLNFDVFDPAEATAFDVPEAVIEPNP